MNEAERFLKSKDFALVLWSVCRGDAVSYCRSHRTVPPFIYTQVLSGLLQFNATGREFYFLFVFLFVFVLVLSGRRRRHLSGYMFSLCYTGWLAHPAPAFIFVVFPFPVTFICFVFFFSSLSPFSCLPLPQCRPSCLYLSSFILFFFFIPCADILFEPKFRHANRSFVRSFSLAWFAGIVKIYKTRSSLPVGRDHSRSHAKI